MDPDAASSIEGGTVVAQLTLPTGRGFTAVINAQGKKKVTSSCDALPDGDASWRCAARSWRTRNIVFSFSAPDAKMASKKLVPEMH